MNANSVEKPKVRKRIRRKLGKEYFILKRHLQWIKASNWAVKRKVDFENSVYHHQSMILRPLKDVDMYLQENKATNLQLALDKINGVVLHPGETFSFWKMVGRPTKAKGYLEGLVLNQGKIDKGTGGGLCQMGNLLFWMVAHSPLSVVERYRHSFDVFPDVNRKVPFGAGATLSYNYIDLQVKNTTQNSFQIKLYIKDGYLHGELLSSLPLEDSYRIEERNHRMDQQIWGGYTRHNQIFQIRSVAGEDLDEKLLVENHAIMMYNPFLHAAE